jgi:hypothetical protein
MERNSDSRLIPVSCLDRDYSFGFRYEYRDKLLEASLDKRGLIFPLFAVGETEDPKLRIVSGYKRLHWAQRKKTEKIPVTFIDKKFNEKELFLLSLVSNWNQITSDLDRMTALHKASKDLGFSFGELQKEIAPLLGLPSGQRLVEEYLKVAELGPEIHRLIWQGKLSFRGVSAFSRFPKEDEKALVEVLGKMHLTSNQWAQAAGWLSDLKKIRRALLQNILSEKTIQEIIRHPKMDERTRGERFFEAVRSLRFPRLSREEKSFRRFKSRLSNLEEIQLDRPEGLEAEGVLLRAKIKDRESLGRVVQFLEHHRGSLESFL